MTLRQLRLVDLISQSDYNISAVARFLHTSQSGITKQVRLLEDELGFDVFVRERRRLVSTTSEGKAVVAHARRILDEVSSLKQVGTGARGRMRGHLVVATSQTHAMYVIPAVAKRFRSRFPEVELSLRHGTPGQIEQFVRSGEADVGLLSNATQSGDGFVSIPCGSYNRIVIAPRRHPITRRKVLTLEAIAEYPIVSYEDSFTGRQAIDREFEKRGLGVNVVIKAIDAEVIKSCVRSGLGIAIISEIAYAKGLDKELVALDASHLFPPSRTTLLVPRRRPKKDFVAPFIELLAPGTQG